MKGPHVASDRFDRLDNQRKKRAGESIAVDRESNIRYAVTNVDAVRKYLNGVLYSQTYVQNICFEVYIIYKQRMRSFLT